MGSGESGPGVPRRVLVVDDEPDFCEIAADVLAGRGYSVRTALDPELGLEALAAEPADVVLVDLQMPKGGGRRLLRELQARHPGTYAIVVTAYGSETIAVEMLRELGAIDYLRKTDFGEARVVAAIEGALRAKRADAVIARRGFALEVEREGGIATIFPQGFLTAEPQLRRLPLLAAAVEAAREAGDRAVVIDLRHLVVAPPLAFGLLLGAARRLEKAGGVLALCGAGHAVGATLELFDRTVHEGRGLVVVADRGAAAQAVRGETVRT
jgi:DNA-binding response OmpR family regulator